MSTIRRRGKYLLSGRWTPAEIRTIPESLGYVQIAEGEIVITREQPLPAFKTDWSDSDLLALPDDGNRYELLDGELIMSPAPGHVHGHLIAFLMTCLGQVIYPGKLGRLYDQSGFRYSKKDCLAPDIAFVAAEKLPLIRRARRPFPNVAPDLAVEVKSPHDRMSVLERKIAIYFAAGTQEVWVVMPEKRELRVYKTPKAFTTLGHAELLTTPLISGFRLSLAELFSDG